MFGEVRIGIWGSEGAAVRGRWVISRPDEAKRGARLARMQAIGEY